MKRTATIVVGLLLVMFVASFFSARTPAQTARDLGSVVETESGYRVERVRVDAQTCVLIVSRGNAFTSSPCE